MAEQKRTVAKKVAKNKAGTQSAPKLMPKEKVLVSWQAPEFIHHERGALWFVIATIIMFLLIVSSILDRRWITAIVFALLLGVVYLFSHEKPQSRFTVISNLGIHAGDKFFPYADIKSFWIIYHEGAQTFNFQMSGSWGTIITTQLGNQDPAEIRAALRSEVAEEENKHEPLLDKLSRWLKI